MLALRPADTVAGVRALRRRYRGGTAALLERGRAVGALRTDLPTSLLLALLFLVGGLLFSQFSINALIVLFGAAIITMLAYLGSRKIAPYRT